MQVIRGTGASPGVTIGPVVKIDRGVAGLHRVVHDPFRERALYEAAIVLAKAELRQLQQNARGPEADIFIFQIALLEDESFTNEIGDYISAGAGSAAAVERAEQIFAARLDNVDDDYIRERSVDVRDACRRVVDILDGRPRLKMDLTKPAILAADQFFPSDVLSIERSMILGFISDTDSATSHAAILARSLGIPALVRLGAGAADAAAGHQVVLDTQAGRLIIDPAPEQIAQANHKIAQIRRRSEKPDALAAKPCFTRDGTPFELWANCTDAEGIEAAMHSGASGIGLVRSEPLLMMKPTEDQQYFHYVNCLAAAGGAPVTVRTYDIGAVNLDTPVGENPALGLRGVRMLSAQRQMFDEQICALLRAGKMGDLRVVLPMVGGTEDWDACMREIERCKDMLSERRVDFNANVPFGCLVEVPAAALCADELLEHGAQFLMLGMNDLVQYACAADRSDERVAPYYRVDSTGVRKLVEMVVKAAHSHRRLAYISGISVETPPYTENYMRMGFRTLSVEVPCLHEVKSYLLGMELQEQPG
ncbi:MAG: putative PEP-binding protein [Gemmiger sp.]